MRCLPVGVPGGGVPDGSRRLPTARGVGLGVGVEIRRVSNEELPTHALPLQQYAFGGTPTRQDSGEEDARRRSLAYQGENTFLVAEEDGAATAVAYAIPMHQNV